MPPPWPKATSIRHHRQPRPGSAAAERGDPGTANKEIYLMLLHPGDFVFPIWEYACDPAKNGTLGLFEVELQDEERITLCDRERARRSKRLPGPDQRLHGPTQPERS